MKPIRWLRRGLTLASLGAAGSAAIITVRHVLATPQPLENRLFGDIDIDRRREGDIYYTMAGPRDAEPYVLLHDFYAGASSYEYRRLYPRLAADHRVYAPDWLGFGLSERPALAYTGEFYARLLNGFVRDTVGRAAKVVAHGLAANVAVRAAIEEPALFARLVLIEPRPLAGTLPGPTLTQTAVRMVQRASLGLVPYAVLSTRAALRLQLARRGAHRGEGAASDDALDEVYANAHQFGGHHALLALLTGELDLPIENALPLLEPPLLIVGGEGPADHPRSTAGLRDLALLNSGATTAFVPDAGDSVHEDQPAALMEKLDVWLRLPQEHAMPQITETRARARFPAGAIRVREGASQTPADPTPADPTPADAMPAIPSASPAASASSPSASAIASTETTEAPATAREARESAQLQPPATTHDDDRPAEELGEPYGLVSAHPHLDALEGLEEHAPEPAESAGELDEPLSTAAAEHHDEALTQVVGKPAGESESETPTTGTTIEPPTVTAPGRQASENTPPSPASPTAPSTATSAAPASGGRSVRTQRGTGRAGGAHTAHPGGHSASGKSGGRPSGGSSSKPSSKPGSGGGRKPPPHRPKKS